MIRDHLASGSGWSSVPRFPAWMSISKFEATVSLQDKVNRVKNDVVFGVSLYGLYAIATGGSGLLAYASYVSLGAAVRKVTSAAVGFLVCPATFKSCGVDSKLQEQEIAKLEAEGYTVNKVRLYKSGVKYAAYCITHPDTRDKGKWTINAVGNRKNVEECMGALARENFQNLCNTLLVNGPAVCESDGLPTRYQWGAGYEAGLQYLEQFVNATHIIMKGFSLGAGTLAEAVLQHDFTEGIEKKRKYLFIADRSFGYLTSMAGMWNRVFSAIGVELDGVAAARKLSALNIHQIVIQHFVPLIDGAGTDGEIRDNQSLSFALHKEHVTAQKTFLLDDAIRHNSPLPEDVVNSLQRAIKAFVES